MTISPAPLRLPVFLLILILSGITTLQGRQGKFTSVPFEMAGSYIIVQARINSTSPLYFILDTGVKNTIITEIHQQDDILINLSGKKAIQGLGQGKSITSFISDSNTISLGKLKFANKTVYLLEDDILGLSQHTGRKINGLIGVDLIQSHVVEIDYSRRRIKFYDQESFLPPKDYIRKPLIIENNKIYLNLTLLDDNGQIRTIKMLIDTGAQLNAWFQTVRSNAAEIPEKRVYARIGEGFSGDFYGYLARIPQICFGQNCFHNPVVVFPDSVMIADIMRKSDRDGTIGNELLSRFNSIIDFKNAALYLKPNHYFKDNFYYNIAGLEITQPNPNLPAFEVDYVWKDSPAAKVGIQAGDMLLEIKGIKTHLMKIAEIRWHFQRVSNQPLNLLVERNQEKLAFDIPMQDLLSYP
ncbi:MAG: aspartyl protease family protein [Paludibacter sp.]|nr:aspartyl protease family protein [Paludibacter sp.]